MRAHHVAHACARVVGELGIARNEHEPADHSGCFATANRNDIRRTVSVHSRPGKIPTEAFRVLNRNR